MSRPRRNYGHELAVDMEDRDSVRYFTRALGCSEPELREAVAAVGPRRANLRMRFRPRPMTRRHEAA
jgi:Protein of unknown function (DUF3606)